MRAETGRFRNEASEKPRVKQGQDWRRGSCLDLLCAVSEGRKSGFKFSGAGRNVAGLPGDWVKHGLSEGKWGL